MRHVVAARVLQDTPSQETGGGTPSVPEGEAIPKELDLLAGMASDDTDYRKVRGYSTSRAGCPRVCGDDK